MIIVADSSPLIALAQIAQLHLLEQLYGEFIVPQAVYDEVVRCDKPYSVELEHFLQGKARSVENCMAVDLLLSDLGIGEAEAIVLALEKHTTAILVDDLKARKLARLKGINVIGTLGILLRAKKLGYIDAISPLIAKLVCNGIRISEKIIDIALTEAQETTAGTQKPEDRLP